MRTLFSFITLLAGISAVCAQEQEANCGKSQKTLSAQNAKPMTIDQVRELLNKSK